MKTLAANLLRVAVLCAASTGAHGAGPADILDLSRPIPGFRVINDGVMGGVSSSRLDFSAGALVFEGLVSLENNGGFASFRGPVRIPAHAGALLLKVRGDGKRYKLTLKNDDSNATGQYQAGFVAPREWTVLRFVPGDFAASFRGRAVAAPPPVFGDVVTQGLLISDGQAGPFRVEIGALSAE